MNNSTHIYQPPFKPAAQQRGEFRPRAWSILMAPGTYAGYRNGDHPVGAVVRFRKGNYRVAPAGNLIRL